MRVRLPLWGNSRQQADTFIEDSVTEKRASRWKSPICWKPVRQANMGNAEERKARKAKYQLSTFSLVLKFLKDSTFPLLRRSLTTVTKKQQIALRSQCCKGLVTDVSDPQRNAYAGTLSFSPRGGNSTARGLKGRATPKRLCASTARRYHSRRCHRHPSLRIQSSSPHGSDFRLRRA